MSVFSEFLLRMRPISESPAVSIKRDFSIKTCNEPCQGVGGGFVPRSERGVWWSILAASARCLPVAAALLSTLGAAQDLP